MAIPSAALPIGLRRPSRAEFFTSCVEDAVQRIEEKRPGSFASVRIGIEEVPLLRSNWTGDRVPMSAGLEASRNRKATLVLYQRPLELRAQTRSELHQLVHRTIVEQLSAILAMPPEDFSDDWAG